MELGFTLENSWASSTAANSARNQTYALTLTTGNASRSPSLRRLVYPEYFHAVAPGVWIDRSRAHSDQLQLAYLASTRRTRTSTRHYTPNADLERCTRFTHDTTGANSGRLTIPGIDNLNGNGGIVDYDENLNGPAIIPGLVPIRSGMWTT